MYIVYAICNERNNIYVGYTDDLTTRIQRHNGKLPSKPTAYTSTHRFGVWRVFYSEEFKNRKEARKREQQLKTSRGRDFLRRQLIAQSVDPSADGLLR